MSEPGLSQESNNDWVDGTAIRIDLARLDERVKALPTKWFVVTSVTTIVGLFTALSIFGDKLRAAFGI